MKQDQKDEGLPEEDYSERGADKVPEDAFKEASQIEQIDDSQLPRSITKLFNN